MRCGTNTSTGIHAVEQFSSLPIEYKMCSIQKVCRMRQTFCFFQPVSSARIAGSMYQLRRQSTAPAKLWRVRRGSSSKYSFSVRSMRTGRFASFVIAPTCRVFFEGEFYERFFIGVRRQVNIEPFGAHLRVAHAHTHVSGAIELAGTRPLRVVCESTTHMD
jgi:hypothetical protein